MNKWIKVESVEIHVIQFGNVYKVVKGVHYLFVWHLFFVFLDLKKKEKKLRLRSRMQCCLSIPCHWVLISIPISISISIAILNSVLDGDYHPVSKWIYLVWLPLHNIHIKWPNIMLANFLAKFSSYVPVGLMISLKRWHSFLFYRSQSYIFFWFLS